MGLAVLDTGAPKKFPHPSSASAQALFLGLLCLGTFGAGLSGGFVLDDKLALLQHPVVQQTAPLADAFRLNFWGEPLGNDPPSYRPLTTLSFALDHRLFGGSALAFHLSSLFWYIALALVAWLFARRCLAPGAALLATAFFVVMPVHVENVSSLVGRADTLAVLFCLLALLALPPGWVEGEPPAAWRLVLAALAFAAGLLCKESVAVLPVIVGALIQFRRTRWTVRVPFVRAHLPSLVLLTTLGLYFAVRLSLQPNSFGYTSDDDVLVGAGLWEKIGYWLALLARYVRLVVAPTTLCTGRKYAEVFRPSNLSLTIVAGLGLVAAVVFATWRDARRGGLPFVLSACLAWLLMTGILFAIPESMADRYLLLPSLFLCYALGPALLTVWNKGLAPRAALLTALGLQVVLSTRQARTWRDEGTLWAHAALVCPDSAHNHFRYAQYLSQQGETAEAVWHYAVFTRARHAFPYAWSHPAREEERSMPVEQRLREMHRLLKVDLDEGRWRGRFASYLRSMTRWREANLVIATSPQNPSLPGE